MSPIPKYGIPTPGDQAVYAYNQQASEGNIAGIKQRITFMQYPLMLMHCPLVPQPRLVDPHI